MSAGDFGFDLALRCHDLDYLAPRFRDAVQKALAACQADAFTAPAMVYETYRSDALQRDYYTRGRPPSTEYPTTVTNARSNLYSWHGYGLAVDVIHAQEGWEAGAKWFAAVAEIIKANQCKWGGDWTTHDLPHMQWGACKPSPSDRARDLMRTGGHLAVWRAVGAV